MTGFCLFFFCFTVISSSAIPYSFFFCLLNFFPTLFYFFARIYHTTDLRSVSLYASLPNRPECTHKYFLERTKQNFWVLFRLSSTISHTVYTFRFCFFLHQSDNFALSLCSFFTLIRFSSIRFYIHTCQYTQHRTCFALCFVSKVNWRNKNNTKQIQHITQK